MGLGSCQKLLCGSASVSKAEVYAWDTFRSKTRSFQFFFFVFCAKLAVWPFLGLAGLSHSFVSGKKSSHHRLSILFFVLCRSGLFLGVLLPFVFVLLTQNENIVVSISVVLIRPPAPQCTTIAPTGRPLPTTTPTAWHPNDLCEFNTASFLLRVFRWGNAPLIPDRPSIPGRPNLPPKPQWVSAFAGPNKLHTHSAFWRTPFRKKTQEFFNVSSRRATGASCSCRELIRQCIATFNLCCLELVIFVKELVHMCLALVRWTVPSGFEIQVISSTKIADLFW